MNLGLLISGIRWVSTVPNEAVAAVRKLEYSMKMKRINEDESKINEIIRLVTDLFSTSAAFVMYEDFVRLLLKKLETSSLEVVENHLNSCNLFTKDYTNLLNQLVIKTEAKISNAEIGRLIVQYLPQAIKTSLQKSIMILEDGNKRLTPLEMITLTSCSNEANQPKNQ